MSVPNPATTDWVPLAIGGAIDYVGDWSPAVNYLPGHIVRYNGVDYLAVNPSSGQAPSNAAAGSMIGTALPSSPFDGQEFILVDSLTAPTYSLRFRYVASIADAYKWVFIGGSPIQAKADGPHITANNQGTYIVLTGGPVITLPRAGIYTLDHGFTMTNYQDAGGGAGGKCYMSYDIGATAAVDADAVNAQPYVGALAFAVMESRLRTFTVAGTVLTAKVRHDNYGQQVTWTKRWMRATPVRVS